VWRAVDLHYSFFQLKKVNWDSVGAHYRPLALAASADREFAVVLSQMLRELKDVHVSITPTGTAGTTRYMAASDTARTYFAWDLVSRRYVPASRTTPGGHVRYGTTAANVGYLRIATFMGGPWESEVDDALERLSADGATSVIVDVRDNAGGQYKLAASIAGRFADRTRTFGYVRYRNGRGHGDFTNYIAETVSPTGPRQFNGRVYVLTNRRSLSSAEDFVLAMRTFPTVTVVGDTTAGASGGPIVRELPNGWTYQLSEWIEYTATRQMFEGVGLPPDIVVKATLAERNRDVDAALERAIALATAAPPSWKPGAIARLVAR
jgi:C-terminal processing protease CtpA/Prc